MNQDEFNHLSVQEGKDQEFEDWREEVRYVNGYQAGFREALTRCEALLEECFSQGNTALIRTTFHQTFYELLAPPTA